MRLPCQLRINLCSKLSNISSKLSNIDFIGLKKHLYSIRKYFELYGWNYAARPERAEALSPGQRPGYKGSLQGAL